MRTEPFGCPGTQDLPGIIETPADKPEWDKRNLSALRRLAGKL
jgi:hypothetical protein